MENTNDDNAFADAQQAENLRQHATEYATAAVRYGHVDRDWVNDRLFRMGAQPVTGKARYRLNTAVTGLLGFTVVAGSRAEAAKAFDERIKQIAAAGQTSGEAIYSVSFPAQEPTFFEGPHDPATPADDGPELNLEGVKQAFRQMLKDGVAEQGWGHSYAVNALETMGLDPLPPLVQHTVKVPVSGTTDVTVLSFEGDDDEVVQRAAAGTLRRAGQVTVTPDEMGAPFAARPDTSETMGLVVDED